MKIRVDGKFAPALSIFEADKLGAYPVLFSERTELWIGLLMVCADCQEEFNTADSACYKRWPQDVRERCIRVDVPYGSNAEKWKIGVDVSDQMEEMALNSNGMLFIAKMWNVVLAKRWQRRLRAYRAAAARHYSLVKSTRKLAALALQLDARTPKYASFGDDPIAAGFVAPSAAQFSQKWHAAVRINRWMRRNQLYSVKIRQVLAMDHCVALGKLSKTPKRVDGSTFDDREQLTVTTEDGRSPGGFLVATSSFADAKPALEMLARDPDNRPTMAVTDNMPINALALLAIFTTILGAALALSNSDPTLAVR
jgi:hypothetical protein